jgi:predicted permease
MRWRYKLPLRLRSLLEGERVDRELRDEIRFHLERQVEENLAQGMSPEAARLAARRALGGVEQIAQQCRDTRRVRLLENLLQDARYGLRALARNPGATVVAVLTLALGIGANTAIFSVLHGVLLRPLPYPHPGRIASIGQASPASGDHRLGVSEPQLLRLRDMAAAGGGPLAAIGGYVLHSSTLTGGAGATDPGGAGATDPGGSGVAGGATGAASGADAAEPERITIASATAGACEALGAAPVLGRCFAWSDGLPGAEPVTILSHGLWRRRFGGDPRIAGRRIQVDGKAATVVGVLPAGFSLPEELVDAPPVQLWRPMAIDPGKLNWGSYYLRPIARLRPGADIGQVRAQVGTVFARLRQENPAAAIRDPDYSIRVVGLHDDLMGDVRAALWVLVGAVAVVLLIACANVASLLLAQAAARQQEIAVRAALGAGPGRLVRQLLTESLLIALVGGAAGIGLAAWGLALISRLGVSGVPRLHEVSLNLPVLVFTLAVSAAAAMLFGLVPAAQLAAPDLTRSLRESGRGLSASGRKHRLHGILVIAEVALAVMLVISAGLLLRSFRGLVRIDPGFDPVNLLSARVDLPPQRYRDNASTSLFYGQLLERLRALPGVSSAAAATLPPLAGEAGDTTFDIEGGRHAGGSPGASGDTPDPHLYHWLVTPGYFQAAGIALVRGRPIRAADGAGAQPVGVINETMARQYWRDGQPLGKRIRLYWSESEKGPWLEIVGVVRDVAFRQLGEASQPELYLPEAQGQAVADFPSRQMTLVLRSAADPRALAAAVRREARAVDPTVPVSRVQTLDELVARSVSRSRFNLILLALFAAVALALAAVGIYGILANAVRQRSREIGIRKALGARQGDVFRLLVGQGMRLTGIGLVLGLGAAAALTRFQQSLLFGVEPTDPLTFGAVALLLCAVSLVACSLPARRALAVDPMVTLRAE